MWNYLYLFLSGASSTVETIDVENHTFVVPKKEIFNPEDIEKKWQISEVRFELMTYISIVTLQEHVSFNEFT